MEQPLWTQGSQFLLSLPFGLALGLFYDLLRGLRRYARWMTHLLDALFVVNYLLANLLFALYIGGGEFRIFMLLGSLLGVGIYFLTLSRLLLPVICKFWALVTLPARKLCSRIKIFLQKVLKKVKKLFSSAKKSVIIKKVNHNKTAQKKPGGTRDATAQIITHYKAADPDAGHLRHRHHRHVAAANPRTEGR